MERYIFVCLASVIILQTCYAPPVTQTKKKEEAPDQPDPEFTALEDYMEYHRYLKEVVSALESDPDFRQKLENANESEIKSGKIADELEFVNHHVRTRLDEIKRVELERLKELIEKKRKLENNSIDDDPLHHHLDQYNPHTFEIQDLKKLIAKTTADLAQVDKKRKDEFKQYEMEKEFQKQDKLNHTTGQEHEKLEKQYKELEEKHKKHEKLHEPGHKAQLEEVWEEQDNMQQDFDPKAFFMLHDVDGNGLWDQNEVKALFVKELDKIYQAGAPGEDMRERYEEMERMRETVFTEMDKNRDGFIEFEEFMQQTNTVEFKEDHGWKSIDEQLPYTDQELEEYIRQNNAYHASQGLPQQQLPPGGYQNPPPVAYNQVPPSGYQQIPPGGYHPQGYQQAPPVQGYQQVPPQGQQQGYLQGGYQQVPPGGYQPVGHQQQGQVPRDVQRLPDLNTNEIHQQYPAQPQYDQKQPKLQQINQPPQVNQHNINQQPPTNQQQQSQVNYQQVNQKAEVNQQQQVNQQQPHQVNFQQGNQPAQINQQQVHQQQNLPPLVNQQH